MKLSVDHLTGTPSDIQLTAQSGWWQEMRAALPELSEQEENFRFEVRAHRMGQDVFVEGQVTGEIELGCGRCLSRYRHALREGFRLVLEPAGDRIPTDPDGVECLARDGVWFGDELDSGWFWEPSSGR